MPESRVRRWYEFKAQTDDQGQRQATIFLYDEIGIFGVTAKGLIDEVNDAGALDQITLRINSPGGSVFDSLALHNFLRGHDARIDVLVDGLAASGASIVAMAGDSISMAENALMMVHNPFSIAFGDADDMRQQADALDKMRDSLISVYARRTGQSSEKIGELLDAETWLSAAEAVDLGFADEVTDAVDIAATARFDVNARLNAYQNAPTISQTAGPPVTKPQEQLAMNAEQLAALAAKLGLPADATAGQIMATVEQQGKDVAALTQVAQVLELDEGASGDEILGAVTGTRESVVSMSERIDAVESRNRQFEADQRVAKAKREGKVTAENEAWAAKTAIESPEVFDGWAVTARKIVPVTPIAPRTATSGPSVSTFPNASEDDKAALAKMTPQDIKACRQMGLKPAAFMKYSDPARTHTIHDFVDQGGAK